MKKTGKQSPETHREFLDLDTDDEDFGPQKTPEVEEELPPEPEKPLFSNEELNTLVHYVQDLTVLPMVKASDWNEECCEVIREYFRDPSRTTLAIFRDKGKLTASLRYLSDYDSRALVFFARSPWHIYTVANFFDTIQFVMINGDVNNCILKFMENIYAPIVLKNDWPQIIQNNLFSSLHGFLFCLTDYVYKLRGRTVLYIPREGLQEARKNSRHDSNCDSPARALTNNILENLEDKTKLMLERLENVVRFWIKQIREALASIDVRKNIKSIEDEVQHWNAIYSNFKYLHNNQLKGKDIQSIIQKLSNVYSANTEPFQRLIIRVEDILNESRSNLEYLRLLPAAGKNDDILNEIDINITRTLYMTLFIWLESPFYKTRNNMESLYQALTTQIITRCQEYVELNKVFDGNEKNVILKFEQCILYCKTYKEVFSTLTKNILPPSNSENNFDIDKERIFNRIDAFIRRCNDVIDICNVIIVFGRCNKVGMLGGPRGIDYERYCRKIETLFHKHLKKLSLVQNIILDIDNYEWIERNHKFRIIIIELEQMVKNLIDYIFNDVTNVQEGIEAIYALQIFKHRKCLQQMIEKKWTQVWLIFSKEIEQCSVEIIEEMKTLDFISFYQSEIITILLIKQRYLNQQYESMINASDWFGATNVQAKYTLERYKSVMDAMDRYKNVFIKT